MTNYRTTAPSGKIASNAEGAVVARRAELQVSWRAARATDKLFAVDRLLKSDALDSVLEARIVAAHSAVRAAWASARAAKIAGAALAQKQHELALMIAEVELDRALDAPGMFDALFSMAETYLRQVPRAADTPTFQELLRTRDDVRRAVLRILPPELAA